MNAPPEQFPPTGTEGRQVDVEAVIVQLREEASEREQKVQTNAIIVAAILVAIAVIFAWFVTKAIVRRVGGNWKAMLIAAFVSAGLYFVLMTLILVLFGEIRFADVPARFVGAHPVAWVLLAAMVVAATLTAWVRIGLLRHKARKIQQAETDAFS